MKLKCICEYHDLPDSALGEERSIEDYYKTSAFVQAVENRQGFKIACLEEIALLNKWINKKDVKDAISFYGNCEYSSYLKKLI